MSWIRCYSSARWRWLSPSSNIPYRLFIEDYRMISFASGEAAPSFDHPLEMLHVCHGKIQRQLSTLQKLVTYLPAHGCDQQVQQAAQGILRYSDTAGQFHHQDEEENL